MPTVSGAGPLDIVPAALTNFTVSAKQRGHSPGGAPGAPEVGLDAIRDDSASLTGALGRAVATMARVTRRPAAAAAADRADIAGEAFDHRAPDRQRLARRTSAKQALERAFEPDQAIAELNGHL